MLNVIHLQFHSLLKHNLCCQFSRHQTDKDSGALFILETRESYRCYKHLMITPFVSFTPVACETANQNTTKTRITTLLLYVSTAVMLYFSVCPDSNFNTFIHESKQMFVPDVKKFLPGVSEIKLWWEWNIHEVSVTFDLWSLITKISSLTPSDNLKKCPQSVCYLIQKNVVTVRTDGAVSYCLLPNRWFTGYLLFCCHCTCCPCYSNQILDYFKAKCRHSIS